MLRNLSETLRSVRAASHYLNLNTTTPMKFQRILVPVDFSEHSLAGVKTAAALAKQLSGTLILLHAFTPPLVVQDQAFPMSTIPNDPELPALLKGNLIEMARQHAPDVTTECLVEIGYAWSTICDIADKTGVDMIVCSSHGYTGLKRMLLGSTAEQIVRHSKCPVLVVKNFTE